MSLFTGDVRKAFWVRVAIVGSTLGFFGLFSDLFDCTADAWSGLSSGLDSGYYDDSGGFSGGADAWSYSGIGGHVGGDGETFYFIDGDSSYISGG